ncbi:MAG: zf-HC2 domain-containing protein [Phycisphaerae bacterium]|nr:zf-HC2 domain-containing protein [Phycisphaerae bacterium]
MKCSAVRTAIQRNIDGELTADAREALTTHVAGCPSCRAYQQQMTAIRSALHDLAVATETPDVTPAPLTFPAPRQHRWAIPFAAAAAIAICASGWLIMHTMRTTENAAPPIVHLPDETPQLAKLPTPTPEPAHAAPRQRARVRFDPSQNVIAVPYETKHSNVTLIWVYPSIKTAQATGNDATESTETNPRSNL